MDNSLFVLHTSIVSFGVEVTMKIGLKVRANSMTALIYNPKLSQSIYQYQSISERIIKQFHLFNFYRATF
ncbi:MAG: hypothetical protein ABJK35_05875 [Balneola sp.]